MNSRLLALLLLLPLCGCASFAARQIEHPDDQFAATAKTFTPELESLGFHHEVQAVTPGLRIAYWQFEPHRYEFRTHTVVHGSDFHLYFHVSEELTEEQSRYSVPVPVRGSVMLLHGLGEDGASMAPWALVLARRGYRVLMPDLPGQGESSSMRPGFGPREARVIAQLISLLRLQGQLPEPFYLLGESYGADVAIFTAAQLHGVDGTVALEPFASPVQAILRAPGSGLFVPKWLGDFFGLSTMRAAIARADRDLGIDLAAIEPGHALAQVTHCVAVVGGSRDGLTTVGEWRRMLVQAPHARLTVLPGDNHIDLLIRLNQLGEPVAHWMRQVAARPPGAHCPAVHPLPPAYRVLQPQWLPKAPDALQRWARTMLTPRAGPA